LQSLSPGLVRTEGDLSVTNPVSSGREGTRPAAAAANASWRVGIELEPIDVLTPLHSPPSLTRPRTPFTHPLHAPARHRHPISAAADGALYLRDMDDALPAGARQGLFTAALLQAVDEEGVRAPAKRYGGFLHASALLPGARLLESSNLVGADQLGGCDG